MQFITQFSTTRQTATGAGSSNMGVLSFSSNSVINDSKGPPLISRLRDNMMLLSTNMHRYTQNSTIRTDISQAVRLLQCYVLFLIPGFTDFWGSNSATSTISHILNIPLTLCIFPDNVIYNFVITALIFAFQVIHCFLIVYILLKNPEVSSLSNRFIAWICWALGCIFPIIEIPIFYLAGSTIRAVIVWRFQDVLTSICFVLDLLNALIMMDFHYISFAVYRCSPTINFNGLLRPWPRYVIQYSWIEIFMMILSFFEGILDPNNKIECTIVIVVLLLFSNPVLATYFLKKPIFQDIEDSVHYAVCLTVGFINLILILIHNFVPFLTPSILFSLTILFVIIFYLAYRMVFKKKISKIITQLFSVYKSSRPILPPLTPVVFSNPLSNQITLSEEAYSVMQAFSSLGIEDEDTFNIFLAVGAKLKVPSIRNNDFIKWGLNYFTSATTILASSQLIQYFNGCARTETVILQKIREIPKYPNIFKPFIQHLEGLHADVMLDKPILLRGLCTKADAALSRCKRSIALFWGCVLRRSNSSIREALCRVRDSINEAEPHFQELMRCYPFTKQAITLYLSFLLEVKGSFEECYEYLNYMTTYFLSKQSEIDVDEDPSTNFLTTLLNDETNTFHKYVAELPVFADHEHQAMACSSSVTNLLYGLAISSIVVLVGCSTFIMITLLLEINKLPSFVSMIKSCYDVTSLISRATTASRRLCLLASNILSQNTTISMDEENIDDLNLVIQTIISASNRLPRLVQNFLVSIAYSNEMIVALNHWNVNLTNFNLSTSTSLSLALKLVSDSIRSIILMIPLAVKESGPIPEYELSNYSSICGTPELTQLFYNVPQVTSLLFHFTEEFEKEVDKNINSILDIILLTLEIMPFAFFAIFVILVLISVSIAFKESKFRATLFLSLPEQVASGFFRSENGPQTKKPAGIESIFSVPTQPGRIKAENAKDKIQIIEKLHEFSSIEQAGYNTGIQSYTISIIIFLFLSSLTMTILLLYGKMAFQRFDEQSVLISYSTLRNLCLEFASYYVQELFLQPDDKLLDDRDTFEYAKQFMTKSLSFHNFIIFGNDRNFNEFSDFKDMFFWFNDSISDFTSFSDDSIINISNTIMMMQHGSYIKFGFDLKSRLFFIVLRAFIDIFQRNPGIFQINDIYWEQFDHFLFSHLQNDLNESALIYFDGILSDISRSFDIFLVIFFASFIVLIIIFAIVVIPSIIKLQKFFNCGVRLLCQVPHNVFQRSLFINKWLKGQITRSNFMALETHFNRFLSPVLQSKIIKELPESIYIFDVQGNYINSTSPDVANLEDKTMKNILPLVVDASHDFQLLSVAESARTKFAEAKDNVQPIIYQAKSVNGVPIRLTFVGVSAMEAGIITKDSVYRQYYTYIAILARDTTQESNQENQYHQQKEFTKSLMKRIIPNILIERVHDGERRISNVPIDGTAILMQFCDYSQFVLNVDVNTLPTILQQVHNIINATLNEYQNVILVSFNSSLVVFATGIFDDELTDRVKAIDSVSFANALQIRISDYMKSAGLILPLKFAIATNQIIYKMQLDVSLISFITGDAVQLAGFLLKKAKPNQILVERRTYECIYGQNCDAQHVGEYEFKSSIVTIYSITVKE